MTKAELQKELDDLKDAIRDYLGDYHSMHIKQLIGLRTNGFYPQTQKSAEVLLKVLEDK